MDCNIIKDMKGKKKIEKMDKSKLIEDDGQDESGWGRKEVMKKNDDKKKKIKLLKEKLRNRIAELRKARKADDSKPRKERESKKERSEKNRKKKQVDRKK